MPNLTITLNGNSVTVVPYPVQVVATSEEPSMSDAVALVASPFTGQTQRQGSTGADITGLKLVFPPLTSDLAPLLLGWLAEMRGMATATQLTPPSYKGPRGAPAGSPVANSTGTGTNVAGSTTLITRGWTPGQTGLLLPWDLCQLGYRLHRVSGTDGVTSDAAGNATFSVYPSLREDVADGTPLTCLNPRGLYGLADNKRNWATDVARFTTITVPLIEYR